MKVKNTARLKVICESILDSIFIESARVSVQRSVQSSKDAMRKGKDAAETLMYLTIALRNLSD